MTDKQFVHLHVHAENSTLDGLARTPALIEAAANLGQPAIAITDHGTMAGAYDMYKTAKAHGGIKGILGIEAYVAPGVPRTHKAAVRWAEGGDADVSGAGAFLHQTLLAATDEGLRNLMYMSSEGYLTGFYRRSRLDDDLLSEHSKGVIATSGCPSGEVQTWLRIGDYEKAKAAAAKYRDIFEPGNFFIELMNHGLSIEKQVIPDLMRIGKELKIPFVATNDLHYVRANDATAHDALLCIGSGSQIAEEKRFRFDSQDFYLKTAAEMRALWDMEVPDACDNTLLIAEKCEVHFETKNLMPKFPVPDGETADSWLRKEVRAGLHKRYPNGIPEDRFAREAEELDVICGLGFADYFLITADFIKWARNNGVMVGPGRGSAAGSLVSYALEITQLDPVQYKLYFARFLNVARATGADASPPDIDIDFDDRGRGRVIEYVTQKYGQDKVVGLVTSMQMKAKAAIKDCARVLGHPYAVGEALTKVYPKPVVGRDLSLEGAYDPANERFDEAKEFRELVSSSPDYQEIVTLARQLEGSKRGFGQHAAGIIMSSEPIVKYVPLMKKDGNPESAVLTQWEYKTCETLGLLKMDFLGLSNLGTLTEALRQIKNNRGIEVDLNELTSDPTDPKAFQLLARGESLGVFQLDSPPMRALLRLMNPDKFEDISAVLALFRPGPLAAGTPNMYADRKNGRRKVEAIHPELEEPLKEILGETFGLITYQEQVMAIAQALAGYSMEQADLLRRAMGKKKKEVLDQEFVGFSAGMKENGYSDACIEKLWEILVPFSDYAFNRAHSAAYGMVSYWTAYLKANYPTEYMAALLTTNSNDKDKTAIYLAECRRMGIEVLSPDVNLSDASYTATGDAIRFGLAAVKNVGAAAVNSWLETRAEKGPATSFADFLAKTEVAMCAKRPVESLIKAGAFDSFGHSRAALNLVHIEAVEMARAVKKNQAKNQDSLFGNDADMFSVEIPGHIKEWDQSVLLSFEREMLGLYVSGHPLADLSEAVEEWADVSITDVKLGSGLGGMVKIAGLVSALERKVTRKGDPWAILTVEDLDSSIQVYCFPRTYQQARDILATDAVLIVTGRPEAREDGTYTLMASTITAPNLTTAKRSDPQLWKDRQAAHHAHDQGAAVKDSPSDAPPLVVRVEEADLTVKGVNAFKATLGEFPGPRRIQLQVQKADGSVVVMALSDDFTVKASAGLAAGIRAVFGPDAL